MIPDELLNITELEEEDYPSTTYKLDLVNKRVTNLIDEREAIMQAIQKIILTERYSRVIYDSDYGIELQSLIGKNYDYIISEIGRRIEEALIADDRILEITNATYVKNGDSLSASFTVNTIYGDYPLTMGVMI